MRKQAVPLEEYNLNPFMLESLSLHFAESPEGADWWILTTSAGVKGLGLEVKAPDRNSIEAQVQLEGWMVGLVSWRFSSSCVP